MVVAANEKLQKVQDILANFVQAWLVLLESTPSLKYISHRHTYITYAAPPQNIYYSYFFIGIHLKQSKTCLSTMRCLIR